MLYNMAKIYIIYEIISLSTTFLYYLCCITNNKEHHAAIIQVTPESGNILRTIFKIAIR